MPSLLILLTTIFLVSNVVNSFSLGSFIKGTPPDIFKDEILYKETMTCLPNYVRVERWINCYGKGECKANEAMEYKACTWRKNPCIFGDCKYKCVKCVCRAGYTGYECNIPIDD